MLSCLQSFHQFLRASRKDDLLPGFMLCIPRWGRTQLLSHTKTRSAILLYAVSNESETRTRPILSALWHPDALFCAGIAPQSIPGSDPSHPQGAGPCGALQPCKWRRLCTVSSQKASHKGKNHASFLLPKLVKCYPQQFSSVGMCPGGEVSCSSTPWQSQKEGPSYRLHHLNNHQPLMLLKLLHYNVIIYSWYTLGKPQKEIFRNQWDRWLLGTRCKFSILRSPELHWWCGTASSGWEMGKGNRKSLCSDVIMMLANTIFNV